MQDAVDIAEQFEKHLNSPKQTWLLGAGISFASNIPLMRHLTERVLEVANNDVTSTAELAENNDGSRIISFIQCDIPQDANIEEFLTHLGDLISIAERSRTGSVSMNGQHVTKEKLIFLHRILLRIIADTVRWGYKPPIRGEKEEETETAIVGIDGESIVEVTAHSNFVQAIFGSGRAGLEMIRTPVEFFTTNYDTLLEDALALYEIHYRDGFLGGAVAFWRIENYKPRDSTRAIVTKLHGSVDWHRPMENTSPVFRVRTGDNYPADGGGVMIYPQATKYLNAQRDPFANLFQRFRKRLMQGVDQVLLICGYSFGDEHINAEIEIALSSRRSQLTVVAFADELDGSLPASLQSWRMETEWGNQIFIASSSGLYQGACGPLFKLTEGSRDWWTFAGVTRLLSQGLPGDIIEEMQ